MLFEQMCDVKRVISVGNIPSALQRICQGDIFFQMVNFCITKHCS